METDTITPITEETTQPEQKQRRAALYLRVSTDEQAKEGFSLELQEEKGRGYCKLHEHALAEKHIYKDDISGTFEAERRPGLGMLFEAARNGEFDVVVIYKIDRLARSLLVLKNTIHELEKLGIGLKSVMEQFDTQTPIGRTNVNILGTFAEFERDQIRDRTMGGRMRAMEMGRWVGITPYGYTKDKETRKLVVNEKEARVVRKIYGWLVNEQLSLREVERRMNRLKIPAPFSSKITKRETQNYWHKRTIGRILTNEVFTGRFCYRKYKRPFNNLTSITESSKLRPQKEWICIETPPIISPEMFKAAKQQLLRNREFAKRKLKNMYLYSKIVRCGRCGFKMFGGFQPPRGKWNYPGGYYYHGIYREKDAAGKSKRCAWCPNYSEARMEPIWECLRDILKNPANIMTPLERYVRKGEDPHVITGRLAEIHETLENLGQKRIRANELYIANKIKKEELNNYYRDYDKEEKILNDEALKLRQSLLGKEEIADQKRAIEGAYKRIQTKLDETTRSEKAKIIHMFVESITLHATENYAEVVCKFPSNTETRNPRAERQGLGVNGTVPLVLRVNTIPEEDRRAYMLKTNPGMYVPKSLI